MPEKIGTTDDYSNAPTPAVVSKFHQKSDVDASANAQHHSLGPRSTQSAAGNHTHQIGDGGSVPVLDGVSLTGSKGGNAALASVIAALVLLGATDNTT